MKHVRNFVKEGLVLAVLLVSAANAAVTQSSGSVTGTKAPPSNTLSKPGWGG